MPWATPITAVYGRPLQGMTLGVGTELAVARTVDEATSTPSPRTCCPQEAILTAPGRPGSGSRARKTVASPMPAARAIWAVAHRGAELGEQREGRRDDRLSALLGAHSWRAAPSGGLSHVPTTRSEHSLHEWILRRARHLRAPAGHRALWYEGLERPHLVVNRLSQSRK